MKFAISHFYWPENFSFHESVNHQQNQPKLIDLNLPQEEVFRRELELQQLQENYEQRRDRLHGQAQRVLWQLAENIATPWNNLPQNEIARMGMSSIETPNTNIPEEQLSIREQRAQERERRAQEQAQIKRERMIRQATTPIGRLWLRLKGKSKAMVEEFKQEAREQGLAVKEMGEVTEGWNTEIQRERRAQEQARIKRERMIQQSTTRRGRFLLHSQGKSEAEIMELARVAILERGMSIKWGPKWREFENRVRMEAQQAQQKQNQNLIQDTRADMITPSGSSPSPSATETSWNDRNMTDSNQTVLAKIEGTEEEKKQIREALAKSAEQEKQQWEKKDTITSLTAVAQHAPEIKNATPKSLSIRIGTHPSREDALATLLSWGSLIYQGNDGKESARIFFKDKKAYIRSGGQDFELTAKNGTENYVNMFLEMSNTPIFQPILRSGYAHGLKQFEEAFRLKYSTEKIGDYKEHFYEVVFSELYKATGTPDFNIKTREEFRDFFIKMQNPINYGDLKDSLISTEIFDNEGKITNVTLARAQALQDKKNTQTNQWEK